MTQTKKLNLTFLILTAVYIGGSLLYNTLTAGSDVSVYLSLAVSQLLVLLPAACYMRSSRRSFRKHIWHRPLRGSAVLCLIGCMLLMMPLLAFLNLVSSMFAGNAAEALVVSTAQGPLWLNVLFLAVFPAFTEEFVFRGVFFQGYRRHGLWKAMLISGLFFGLLHLNFNQFSYGFALGVLFALFVEATGSIYASVLVHFLINFQSVMVMNSMSRLSDVQTEQAASQLELSAAIQQSYLSVSVITLFVMSLFAAVLLFFLIRLLAKLSDREDYFAWVTRGGERAALAEKPREPIADVFFFGAVIVCVGFMIYALL